ncbi:carbonic anhydrase [Arthrobacter globiformis]|nr:carbonic anhydrase [Arthrobacter globiformis]
MAQMRIKDARDLCWKNSRLAAAIIFVLGHENCGAVTAAEEASRAFRQQRVTGCE